jgi:hypothetical protein
LRPTDAAPALTLPPAEAEALRRAYGAAEVILEYGSGGSTLVAAELPGRTVLSVESDPEWARMVARHAAAVRRAEQVVVRHVDIGPVRRWGAPSSRRHAHLFHRYPLAIWSDPDFRHPDVVLIDGRFRPACFVTVAFKIERPVTVLFDDYLTRPRYAEVERLGKPVEIVGRMARFELEPRPIGKEHLDWIAAVYADPDYARKRGPLRLIERLGRGLGFRPNLV